MIFATDLDRTIIHSSKFVDNASQVKCIEILDDKEISYMSHLSIELINKIKKSKYSTHPNYNTFLRAI